MATPALCLSSRGDALPCHAPDMDKIADVPRCELCGKPLDRDEANIQVDARDFANWMAALWVQDHRMAGLAFARIASPRAPLQELACLVGCSKATTTRLWQRLGKEYPQLAEFIRGTERRGGDRTEANYSQEDQ